MVNIVILFVICFVVFGIGGGFGYLIWLRTRPKKETWNAKVYIMGEGVRKPVIDKKTGKVSSLRLNDLKPYSLDIAEKIEREPGITIYRLQKLDKVLPPIEGDVVDYWGKGNREISVLYHNGQCSIISKGYDQQVGERIFRPMSQSKINLIKSEMALRKERLQKPKDILQAITPWIVTGIWAFAFVAMTYLMITGFVNIGESYETATANHLELEQTSLNKIKIINGLIPEDQAKELNKGSSLGKQESPPAIEEI